MTPKQLSTFLGKQPFFWGLSPDELGKVTPLLEIMEFPAGHHIFAEGQPGDGWYMVVKGEVAILKETNLGEDHELARLEAGEQFGEMALIDDAPRLGTAQAETPVVVAHLPRASFYTLLEEHSSIGNRVVLAMARVLCRRQRELTAIITDLVDDPETAAPGPREMLSLLLLSTGGRGD